MYPATVFFVISQVFDQCFCHILIVCLVDCKVQCIYVQEVWNLILVLVIYRLLYGYQNLPQTDICILVFQHNPFQVPNWLKILSKHSFCTVHTLLCILPLFFFASDLLIVGSERASFKYPRAFGTSDNLSWPLQEVYQ